MVIEVTLKKWGNSMGVIFPKEIIEKEHFKERDKIKLEIVKEADLRKLFGSLKRKFPNRKHVSGQEFKNMVREGWK